MSGINMFFKAKKRLWTVLTEWRGADSAYAKYLAHFNQVQKNATDAALQKELQVKAMTKEEFIRVWNGKQQRKQGCCK